MLIPEAIPKDVYAPEASCGVTDAVLRNINAHLTETHITLTLGISDASCVCTCLFNESSADSQQHQEGGKVLGWRHLRYLPPTGPGKRHGR